MERLAERDSCGNYQTTRDIGYADLVIELAEYEELIVQGKLVEVVRCKDCKYGGDYNCHYKYGLKFYKDDDYCSNGVTK